MKQDSKYQIAKKYALALYLDAEENKTVSKIQSDIDKMLDVLGKDDSFLKNFSNPLFHKNLKKEALKEIASKLSLSKDIMRCLDLVVDNDRVKELELILKEFKHIYYKKQNIKEVSVESVKTLSSAQDKKLQSNLEKFLSSKVVINYKINPEVLGGLVISYDSNMIDDSIKGKLNKIELSMKGGQ